MLVGPTTESACHIARIFELMALPFVPWGEGIDDDAAANGGIGRADDIHAPARKFDPDAALNIQRSVSVSEGGRLTKGGV